MTTLDRAAVVTALRAIPQVDRAAASRRAGLTCARGCPPRLPCIHPTHQGDDALVRFAAECGIRPDGSRADAAPEPMPTPRDPEPIPAPVAPPAGNADAALAALRTLLAGDPAATVATAVREATAAALKAVDARLSARGAPCFHVRVSEAPAVKIDGVAHAALPAVLRALGAGLNVLLVGPAGCGKTHLAEQAAAALGLPFSFTSLSGGVSESALTGMQIPADGGRVVYVPSVFVDAYENGGLVLLDELDAADPNVLLVLNAALANGKMSVPRRADRPVAIRHKDFRCIAAANTYGHGADRRFVGRNELDESTLSRFRAGTVALDYDPVVEAAIVDAEVLEWGRAVRKHLLAESSRRTLDTRYLRDATLLKAAGASAAEWRAGFLAGWKADELARLPKGVR